MVASRAPVGQRCTEPEPCAEPSTFRPPELLRSARASPLADALALPLLVSDLACAAVAAAWSLMSPALSLALSLAAAALSPAFCAAASVFSLLRSMSGRGDGVL